MARRLLRALLGDRDRYDGLGRRDTLGALEKSFELYMTHDRVAGLPADANITENVIKQLSARSPRSASWVDEPEQHGCEDEAAAVDDGVLFVSGGQPAPVFEAVEGAFDDVASAVGGAVVGTGRPSDEPMRLRWAFRSSGPWQTVWKRHHRFATDGTWTSCCG